MYFILIKQYNQRSGTEPGRKFRVFQEVTKTPQSLFYDDYDLCIKKKITIPPRSSRQPKDDKQVKAVLQKWNELHYRLPVILYACKE